MTRVLHVPFGYFPSACGGTEVYVKELCRALQTSGVQNIIAAPGSVEESYEWDGVAVHRFAVNPSPSLDVLYGRGDEVAAKGFERILDSVQPDVVHFHAFTPAVSSLCASAARQRGLRLVLTFHTPTITCMRGSLMRWGNIPCDGELHLMRCTACSMQGRGLPKPLASLAAGISAGIHGIAGRRFGSVIGLHSLIDQRIKASFEFLDFMDVIVALNQWTVKLLTRLNVPSRKLTMVRHGINVASQPTVQPSNESGPLKLVFLGRIDASKGLDLLVEAFRQTTNPSIKLDVFGLMPEQPDARTKALIEALRGDRRITVQPPVLHDEVHALLAKFDAIVVPSKWLETGPLVVLEAFAAGIPVIGANIGGIAEWVQHQNDGLLFTALDANALKKAMVRLADDRALLGRLKQAVQAPRTMQQVATEMLPIYKAQTNQS